MLKFSPPLTPKFSKFTLPLHCARQFRRRPIQSFKQSNNHSFKQSSIQAIPHPPLCATIPSSPHPNNHPFKQSPIQTIKHSNNQTFKHSNIQAIKQSPTLHCVRRFRRRPPSRAARTIFCQLK